MRDHQLKACVLLVPRDGCKSLLRWYGAFDAGPNTEEDVPSRAAIFEPLRPEGADCHTPVGATPIAVEQPRTMWLVGNTGAVESLTRAGYFNTVEDCSDIRPIRVIALELHRVDVYHRR